jgi:hypothetical protein
LLFQLLRSAEQKIEIYKLLNDYALPFSNFILSMYPNHLINRSSHKQGNLTTLIIEHKQMIEYLNQLCESANNDLRALYGEEIKKRLLLIKLLSVYQNLSVQYNEVVHRCDDFLQQHDCQDNGVIERVCSKIIADFQPKFRAFELDAFQLYLTWIEEIPTMKDLMLIDSKIIC